MTRFKKFSVFYLGILSLVILSCNEKSILQEKDLFLGRWEVKGHLGTTKGMMQEDIFYIFKNHNEYLVESTKEGFETFAFGTDPVTGGFWEWNIEANEITFYYGYESIENAILNDQIVYWENLEFDGEFLEASVYKGENKKLSGGIILKKM